MTKENLGTTRRGFLRGSITTASTALASNSGCSHELRGEQAHARPSTRPRPRHVAQRLGPQPGLVGGPASDANYAKAAKIAKQGAKPLPMTAYKVELVEQTVLETLEQAAAVKLEPPKVTTGAL